jgi:hypothetical protein
MWGLGESRDSLRAKRTKSREVHPKRVVKGNSELFDFSTFDPSPFGRQHPPSRYVFDTISFPIAALSLVFRNI